MQDGANEFSMEELESLFKETAQETPPVEDGKNSTETPPTLKMLPKLKVLQDV